MKPAVGYSPLGPPINDPGAKHLFDEGSSTSFAHDVRNATLAQLHAPIVPTTVMAVALSAAAALVLHHTGAPSDLGLLLAAIVVGAARIVVLLAGRRRMAGADLDARAATLLFRRHAVVYLAYAAVLGLFGLHNIADGTASVHLTIVCLIVGYGAGVSVLIALRPKLAGAAMAIAVLPTAAILSLHVDPFYRLTAVMLTAMLGAGIHNVVRQAGSATGEIGARLTSQMLAWRDPLTGLWNRRAMDDWFSTRLATHQGMLYAVHSIDLDGFKQVNDRFGHHAGDDVLCAVSRRLARAVRAQDFVVRMGGDEFVILQPGIASERDALGLAERIREMVIGDYGIGPAKARIGLTIGTALGRFGVRSLPEMVQDADDALYLNRAVLRAPRPDQHFH